MRNLSQILNDITATQGNLDQLTTNDPRVAAAFAVRHTMETDKLSLLKSEYREALKGSMVGVLLVGQAAAKTKRFIEITKHELPLIVGDASALYGEVATDVQRTLGRPPTPQQPLDFGALQMRETFASLRRIADRLDIGLRPGEPQNRAALTSFDDIRGRVRDCVRSVNADAPNLSFIFDDVAQKALAEKMDDPVVTVLLTNVEPDEVEALSKLFIAFAVVSELPSRDKIKTDTVMTVFETLRDTVKNLKTQS